MFEVLVIKSMNTTFRIPACEMHCFKVIYPEYYVYITLSFIKEKKMNNTKLNKYQRYYWYISIEETCWDSLNIYIFQRVPIFTKTYLYITATHIQVWSCIFIIAKYSLVNVNIDMGDLLFFLFEHSSVNELSLRVFLRRGVCASDHPARAKYIDPL